MSPTTCTLRLLGHPQLLAHDGRAHPLERRDAALLAALALHGPLPRERALERLWPRAERKAAQNSLRQRLFRLKQVAGRELVSSDAVLTLSAEVVHDIGRFADRLGQLPPADDELLATLDYADTEALGEWVEQARNDWHQRRQALLAQAADGHQQQGRLDVALRCVDRLLHHDPGAERVHRQRMLLHYLRGDRAAALAAFAQCQRMLREHADAEPDAATDELAQLIRRGAPMPDAAPAPAPLPAALLRPPRLIGRETAWAELLAARAQGQALVVQGEPGIGKSRLLADFVDAHTGALLQGARPGDTDLPYALLQRVLRALPDWALASADVVEPEWVNAELARLLPERGPAAPGRLEPLRLQQAVTQALKRARAGGLQVVAVDDFQFADAASQELLLAALGRATPALPALWIAVRAAELPRRLGDWISASAATDAGAVRELHLPALMGEQVHGFVAAAGVPEAGVSQWAETLARRTGGNPLFMLQVLQAAHASGQGAAAWRPPVHSFAPLAPSALSAPFAPTAPTQPIPPTVDRLIEQRLTQLGAPALRLARLAALAGLDFTLELASEVSGTPLIDLADGLHELQRAQLMVDDRFAYDLVAEAALRSVPAALARAMHGEIARALASRSAAPARVAEHWAAAAQWPQAAAAFEHAAAQAARVADEAAWQDRAADCHRRAGNAAAAFAAAVRAATAALAVEPPAQVLQRVEAVSAAASGDSQRLDALLLQATQQLAGGQIAGSAAAANALDLARQLGDRPRELQAVNLHGAALVIGGRGPEALSLFEAMLPWAGTLSDLKAEQNFYSYYGYVLSGAMRYCEALAPIARALELAEQLGQLHEAMTEAGNLSTIHHRLGQGDAAMQSAERAIDYWRRQGEPVGVTSGAVHMRAGVYALSSGRYARALAAFEQALPMFRDGQAAEWATHTEHHFARLWLALGQTARAQQVLTPLPHDASTAARNKRLLVQARIARQAGRVSTEALQQGLVFSKDVYGPDRFDAQLMLASVLPPADALALCDALLQEACDMPAVLKHALVRKADALRRLGRHGEAAAAVRQALAHDVNALELTPAEFFWLALQALEAAGDADGAHSVLQQARGWLAQAQGHVPPEFVDSFRQRNPDHRALLLRHGPADS